MTFFHQITPDSNYFSLFNNTFLVAKLAFLREISKESITDLTNQTTDAK